VGYAGGTKENPTYTALGDHSETIQIDYDPEIISYEELLAIFWDSHNPTIQERSRQYMSIIFYHNEEQRELALASKTEQEGLRGRTIYTELLPYDRFYLAEDYHQKYYTSRVREIRSELRRNYPDLMDFVNSTAAARVNGILGGYADPELVSKELDSYGLSETAVEQLKRYLNH
jgi:peptide-methionine (S)-S-oxide reductase